MDKRVYVGDLEALTKISLRRGGRVSPGFAEDFAPTFEFEVERLGQSGLPGERTAGVSQA